MNSDKSWARHDILSLSDPARFDLFKLALSKGQAAVAEFLFPYAGVPNSVAFGFVCSQGSKDLIEKLLPCFVPVPDSCDHLTKVSVRGFSALVRALIPLSNPKARCSLPLRYAVVLGLDEIIRILYPVSNPLEALDDMMKNKNIKKEQLKILEYLIKTDTSKSHLWDNLQNISLSKDTAETRKI